MLLAFSCYITAVRRIIDWCVWLLCFNQSTCRTCQRYHTYRKYIFDQPSALIFIGCLVSHHFCLSARFNINHNASATVAFAKLYPLILHHNAFIYLQLAVHDRGKWFCTRLHTGVIREHAYCICCLVYCLLRCNIKHVVPEVLLCTALGTFNVFWKAGMVIAVQFE